MAGGALDGIKVIDLTRVLGGPFGTQILADHGADVIKVEPPQGDETRDWGPPFHDGDASYYIGVNRNKRSLGLDLGREEGREVLLRLLEGADILTENYKPGAMERWGLGYQETLKARFPRLIHCRISGFGADGPFGGLPGYDAVIQAMAGMFSINGKPGSGPTRMGIPLVDLGTGLYAVIAILMALAERARSGHGQYIDMTLYDSAIALMHPHVANYVLSGKVPGHSGNAHPNIAPYDTYPTKTVELFLAVGNDAAFSRMCEVVGCTQLAGDKRFATNSDRVTHRVELTEALTEAFAGHDGMELGERLMAAGVPAGPVGDTASALAYPHTAHRAMVAEAGWYKGAGTPIKFSRSEARVERPPPHFGADGRAILTEHGFSAEEIAALAEAGVLVEKRRR